MMMSKGQKRSNREAKKPKQEKAKAAPAASPFAAPKGSANQNERGGQKR
jgi:hypothetical protein